MRIDDPQRSGETGEELAARERLRLALTDGVRNEAQSNPATLDR